jgi:hypothetical protein
MDKDMFLTLFKSIVRPHLEYGSSVWLVIYKKEAIQLENVQRRATKLIKNIQQPNVDFWKNISRLARQKINILTLVLSEKKILNETKKT